MNSLREKKEIRNIDRFSNIELYRIVLIVFVIAYHYVCNSSLFGVAAEHPFTSRSLFYYCIGLWGKTAINGFVLITGYFMCKSFISLQKYIKLLGKIVFYSVVFGVLFSVIQKNIPSFREIVSWFIPIDSLGNGFISGYILFFLLIPFINVLLGKLSKKEHAILVGVLLFIYTLLGTIPNFDYRMNYVSWFSVVYIIGAYIRFYLRDEDFINRCCGILLFLALLLSISSIVVLNWYHLKSGSQYEMFFLADSQKPLALLVALLSFLWFRKIRIKNNCIINTLASTTFGVLLIHTNKYVRVWLWEDLLNTKAAFFEKWGIVESIICILGVYFVCVAIDLIQSITIEKMFMKQIKKWRWNPSIFEVGKNNEEC